MDIFKKGLLAVLGIFSAVMCLGGIFCASVILRYADFQEGKAVVIAIFSLLIAAFGFAAFKCLKPVFREEVVSAKIRFAAVKAFAARVSKRYAAGKRETENMYAAPGAEDNVIHQGVQQESYEETNTVPKGTQTSDLQTYADVQQEYDFVVQHVKYDTMRHEDVPFSFEEEVFFKALIKAMKENELWDQEGLKLIRLSDNTLTADCDTCHIGKVNLRNKMFIEVQKGATQVKNYPLTDLQEGLEKIPAWIKYVKYCTRD